MLNAKITVVPVHGAWAECASWNEIILPLRNQGLKVVVHQSLTWCTGRLSLGKNYCYEKYRQA